MSGPPLAPQSGEPPLAEPERGLTVNARRARSGFVAAAAAAALWCVPSPAADHGLPTYRVTVESFTAGQPLSPPLAATHGGGVFIFGVGRPVSGEAEILFEDGDQSPLFDLLQGSDRVTEVVDLGLPLSSGELDSFEIRARRGDRLSLATMLTCSNDGFTGLDRVRLRQESRT